MPRAMFEGALPRLMVARLLLAFGVLGCLLLSASGASAAVARAGVGPLSGVGRCADGVPAVGVCLNSEVAPERSPDELERGPDASAARVKAAASAAAARFGLRAGLAASRFGQSGARRPGRGAKGARDPGEVQRPELPAG